MKESEQTRPPAECIYSSASAAVGDGKLCHPGINDDPVAENPAFLCRSSSRRIVETVGRQDSYSVCMEKAFNFSGRSWRAVVVLGGRRRFSVFLRGNDCSHESRAGLRNERFGCRCCLWPAWMSLRLCVRLLIVQKYLSVKSKLVLDHKSLHISRRWLVSSCFSFCVDHGCPNVFAQRV